MHAGKWTSCVTAGANIIRSFSFLGIEMSCRVGTTLVVLILNVMRFVYFFIISVMRLQIVICRCRMSESLYTEKYSFEIFVNSFRFKKMYNNIKIKYNLFYCNEVNRVTTFLL